MSTRVQTKKVLPRGIDTATEELLFWKSPQKTGVVFGGTCSSRNRSSVVRSNLTTTLPASLLAAISALFFGLHVYKYQMLSVVALALSVTVATFLAWSLVGSFVNRPLPVFPRVLTEGIQEAEARRVVEKTLPYVNKTLAFAHRILSGKDAFMSIALSVGLFFASRVLATVSLLGLVYAAVVVVFTVPKVYDMHHADIDGAINLFR